MTCLWPEWFFFFYIPSLQSFITALKITNKHIHYICTVILFEEICISLPFLSLSLYKYTKYYIIQLYKTFFSSFVIKYITIFIKIIFFFFYLFWRVFNTIWGNRRKLTRITLKIYRSVHSLPGRAEIFE